MEVADVSDRRALKGRDRGNDRAVLGTVPFLRQQALPTTTTMETALNVGYGLLDKVRTTRSTLTVTEHALGF